MKPTLDPIRVNIVVDTARCSPELAERTIERLDDHDQKTPLNTPTTPATSSGYASLPDLLPVGKSALMAAGYHEEEAGNILQALFNGLAMEYGGKRVYLPKADKMQAKIQAFTA
jgi:Mor family transcriptional regulator